MKLNKKDYMKKYNKETYRIYRSYGICVSCHIERVENGVICEECKRFAEVYRKENREKFNEYQKKKKKERYYILKEKGICPICSEPSVGQVYCPDCRQYFHRLYLKRKMKND